MEQGGALKEQFERGVSSFKNISKLGLKFGFEVSFLVEPIFDLGFVNFVVNFGDHSGADRRFSRTHGEPVANFNHHRDPENEIHQPVFSGQNTVLYAVKISLVKYYQGLLFFFKKSHMKNPGSYGIFWIDIFSCDGKSRKSSS